MLSQYVVVKPIYDYVNQFIGSKPAHRAMKFLNHLVQVSNKDYGSPDEFIDMPRGMLQSMMGDKYYKTIKVLEDKGLITINHYYNNLTHQCKKYKVNVPELAILCNVGGTWCPPVVLSAYNVLPFLQKRPNFCYKDQIINDLKCIRVLPDSLRNLTEKIIGGYEVKFCELDDFDDDDIIVMYNKGDYRQVGAKEAILSASVRGREVVKRKGFYKEVDPVHEQMSSQLLKSINYSRSIGMWENGLFYANRNKTNNRLDTNATQTPNPIINKIIMDNNLVQIDLRNSQFCILAAMLPKKVEFNSFKSLVNNGQLYNFVRSNLNLKSRSEAKTTMFELLFSSYRLNNKKKKMLRELFPETVGWIDNYKKDHGDNTFAIALQKGESKIFIDKVLYNAKRNNKFCLTKHDSLIVKPEDVKYAERSIQKQLKKHGVVGTLKTSGAQIC